MSMGIAVYPDDSIDYNELIRLADIAMYDSKKSGKNRYCYYDGKGGNKTEKRLDIENSMRQAIASQINEFVVFYQPVMDVQTNKFVSCEALVRWKNFHTIVGFKSVIFIMLQCIIDVTLKLIKPQLKELSSKKSRIKCQKDT